MENFQEIGNFIMNHGMATMITVYMLYRDWKYQGQIVTLIGELKGALVSFSEILERMKGNVE